MEDTILHLLQRNIVRHGREKRNKRVERACHWTLVNQSVQEKREYFVEKAVLLREHVTRTEIAV